MHYFWGFTLGKRTAGSTERMDLHNKFVKKNIFFLLPAGGPQNVGCNT